MPAHVLAVRHVTSATCDCDKSFNAMVGASCNIPSHTIRQLTRDCGEGEFQHDRGSGCAEKDDRFIQSAALVTLLV